MLVMKTEYQPEDSVWADESEKATFLDPMAVDYPEENNKAPSVSKDRPEADHSGGNSDKYVSDMEGIRFSESVVKFKDVNCFEDFSINVDGLILDSEIPTHLRTKYYDLCCSQNMYLHDNLISGLNSKLAAGMISEIINIADAIRVAKPASLDHLKVFDRTLKPFEDLGMEVGFLRARIHKLLDFSREFKANMETKKAQRIEAEDLMIGLETRLSDIKGLIRRIDYEIAALQAKNDELSCVFKETAAAAW